MSNRSIDNRINPRRLAMHLLFNC